MRSRIKQYTLYIHDKDDRILQSHNFFDNHEVYEEGSKYDEKRDVNESVLNQRSQYLLPH